MPNMDTYTDEMPPSLKIVPTIYPTSPPVEEVVDRFWSLGVEFDSVRVFGAGDLDSGAWFGLVDNVVIIPEPITISLVGLVGIFVAGRRWHQ